MSAGNENGSGVGGEGILFKLKYCRMCALELRSGGVFIHGEEGRRLQIPEKIRKTLAILVLEEDNLPKKICTDCCASLEDYSKYKDTVLDAQEKLASIARMVTESQSQQQAQNNMSRPASVPSSSLSSCSVVVQEESIISSSCSLSPNPSTSKSTKVAISSSSLSPRRCNICGKRFTTKIALDVHVHSDHSVAQVAPVAVAEVVNEVEVELHIVSPAPSDSHELEENIQGSQSQLQLLISKARLGLNNEDLGTAKASSHIISKELSTTKPPRPIKKKSPSYDCSQCDKTLRTSAGYYAHLMIHKGRRFYCSYCPSSYSQKSTLQAHVISNHTASAKQIYKCSSCAMTFPAKKRLTDHAKTHTTLRSFECKICHKFYKTNKCLGQHMTYHTVSTNAFPCPYCTKCFSTKDKVEQHKNSHLNLWPLGCRFCFRSFNGQANYSKHVKRKHLAEIGNGKVPPPLRKDKQQTQHPKLESNYQVSAELATNASSNPDQNMSNQPQSSFTSGAVSPSYAPPSTVTSAQSVLPEVTNNNSWNNANTSERGQAGTGNKAQILHQSQLVRQEHSVAHQLVPPPQVQQQQNLNQHHSIPIVPMDDMDCAIQTALLSHSHQGDSSGHNNLPMQSYHSSQHHQRQTNNTTGTSPLNSSSSFQELSQNEMSKVVYLTHLNETPLELCVRSNNDDGRTNISESNGETNSSFNQLVDLTSAKIVDLSGVGLVVAAANAQSTSNAQSSSSTSNNSSTSLMYRSQSSQQQVTTMSMAQMTMMPMDLTDQQQQESITPSGNIDGQHNHLPLPLTATTSANQNHNNNNFMNNLVDLSYTGNSNSNNRANSHFQMHHPSQQQDDQMMSTSTFLRELLDLSCSTSTTRGTISTASNMDNYSHQPQLQHQNHFQQQNNYVQPQQYQHHPSQQIQQYELNLSSKPKFGIGQYSNQQSHGQPPPLNPSSSSQNHNQYHHPHPHLHNNPNRSNNNNNVNNNTNQFHNVLYNNDSMFM